MSRILTREQFHGFVQADGGFYTSWIRIYRYPIEWEGDSYALDWYDWDLPKVGTLNKFVGIICDRNLASSGKWICEPTELKEYLVVRLQLALLERPELLR